MMEAVGILSIGDSDDEATQKQKMKAKKTDKATKGSEDKLGKSGKKHAPNSNTKYKVFQKETNASGDDSSSDDGNMAQNKAKEKDRRERSTERRDREK